MATYYYAVDEQNKTHFSAPIDYSIKSPGIYHPENPFPAMVVMKNSQGYHYEIWDDCVAFYEEFCTWKDVTKEVYDELLMVWPEWGKKS